jgi:hypothetical protein
MDRAIAESLNAVVIYIERFVIIYCEYKVTAHRRFSIKKTMKIKKQQCKHKGKSNQYID